MKDFSGIKSITVVIVCSMCGHGEEFKYETQEDFQKLINLDWSKESIICQNCMYDEMITVEWMK